MPDLLILFKASVLQVIYTGLLDRFFCMVLCYLSADLL